MILVPWYPLAKRVTLPDSGGYRGGPWRGVIHSTEGTTAAGAVAAYRANDVSPHFTVSWEAGALLVLQHIPIDRSASALKHPAGTVETNRMSAVQVEVVGFATQAPHWPTPLLDGLRVLMEWIEAQTGIRPQAPGFVPYPNSYGLHNGVRFTDSQWGAFNAWCGHMHVPRNLHGDPGLIDINYLLQRTPPAPKEAAPMYEPPLGPIAAVLFRPGTQDVVAAVSPIGDVYAWGIPYQGDPSGEAYFKDRRVARIWFADDPDAVTLRKQVQPGFAPVAFPAYMIQDVTNAWYGPGY